MDILDLVAEESASQGPQPEEVAEQDAVDERTYDCAIVGGGPAGLSAAVYMGRMRRSVVVIDDDKGRSTWHQVNHNYLGFVEGVHAYKLREIGEKQAARYGVHFHYARAESASYEGEGSERIFTVETSCGPVRARTVILCTGVKDTFPEFEGSMECIGKSMFWCIICDGYESIDRRLVVLGHNQRAASLALELLVFTQNVTLVSWDKRFDIDQKMKDRLSEHGVVTYDQGCELFTCSKGELSSLKLEDGTILELDRLFVAQWIEPNTQLAKQLDVYIDKHGYIVTDVEQLTNIEGLYAAGDVTRMHNHQISSAVHEGGMAAAAANYYLYEDWRKD